MKCGFAAVVGKDMAGTEILFGPRFDFPANHSRNHYR